MRRFYFFLWFAWALRVTVESVLFAAFLAFLIVTFFYVQKGMPPLQKDVIDALETLFSFWFAISWSVALLLSLFRSLKYLFNRCFAGFRIALLECETAKKIDYIGYGDLVKVWRKWFMMLIWITAVLVLFLTLVMHFVFGLSSIFEWLHIFVLYLLVLASGYGALVLLIARCKKVRLERC